MKRVRLSRRAKTARNLLLAALAVLLWRGCLGFPAFPARGAFRQCEQRHMVGPAQVIGSLRLRDNRERLILARDGDVLQAVEAVRYGFWKWQADELLRVPLDGQQQAIPLVWEDSQYSTLLFAVAVPPEAEWVEGAMLYDPNGVNQSVSFSGSQRMGDFIIARGELAEDAEPWIKFDFQWLQENRRAPLRITQLQIHTKEN